MFKLLRLVLIFTFGMLSILPEFITPATAAIPINLTQCNSYIKKGFNPTWTQLQQHELTDWKELPPATGDPQRFLVRKAFKSDASKRPIFTMINQRFESYTYLTYFPLTHAEINQPEALALFFENIGEQWEIYLNGHLLKQRLDYTSNRSFYREKELIIINSAILKPDFNTLAIHVRGYQDQYTGFRYHASNSIDHFDKLLDKHANVYRNVLNFFYLFIGLLYLYYFLIRPEERYHLFFGIYCLVHMLTDISISGNYAQLVHNTDYLLRIRYVAFNLLSPVMLLFVMSLVVPKFDWKVKTLTAGISILAVSNLFLPALIRLDLRLLWAAPIMLITLYIIVYVNAHHFRIFKSHYNKNRALNPTLNKLAHIRKSLLQSLLTTEIGNIVLGLNLYLSLFLIEIGFNLLSTWKISIVISGFYLTIFGIVIILVNKSNRFYAKIAALNATLELEFRAREKAEKEKISLQSAKEIAENANRFKTRFLAQMTHDLRTPLHVIIGILDILAKKPVISNDPTLLHPLRTAIKSGERQLALVNDILDLSKIEAGKLELQPLPMDLNEMLMEINDQIQILVTHRSIEFQILNNLNPDQFIITADKKRLLQILINLLGNAVKFTASGTIRLQISLRNQNQLTFEVSDTGIGIGSEYAKSIFEDFRILQNPQISDEKGTGLGLTIAKGLVEKMNGQIAVEPNADQGSIFRFWIPYQSGQLHEIPISTRPQIRYDYLKTQNVLFCDDDTYSRAYAEIILKNKIQYTLVDSGAKAIEHLKKYKYNIVITDFEMPLMDGRQLLNEIRSLWPDLPVIVLTPKHIKRVPALSEFGFSDFLGKPFKEDELLAVIDRQLGDRTGKI